MNSQELKKRQEKIRNFSIIAHIDHGKSTLADRILEKTETVSSREMQAQLLDSMDLERERGITIKLNAIELNYKAKDGETYILHLIDTPGHVDFTYEVSRSLAACEGAVLVVDAAQGIEAQTLANVYLALDNDLEILPVINKIDLPAADPERVRQEVEDVIGLDASEAVLASAKAGIGIEEILEQIVEKVPAPTGDVEKPLQALIFDSAYDAYRGVILQVRIINGIVKPGDKIQMMSNGKTFDVTEVGIFTPKTVGREFLATGDVGYIAASIKTVADTRVGDTVTLANNPAQEPLHGYKQMNPMVFAGLYPIESNKYNDLREALEKLQLNDASLQFEPETSQALGFGFRCGFLGLLHMDVIQERLEREFNIDLIMTAPSVVYHVMTTDGQMLEVSNPSEFPDPTKVDHIEEPYVKAQIMVPQEFVGAVMELAQRKRGDFVTMDYIDDNRVNVIYQIPLAEIVFDFFDKLKSSTRGYASFDYEISEYRKSQLVKMDILLNAEKVDALSFIVHKEFAYERGKLIVEKLKKLFRVSSLRYRFRLLLVKKLLLEVTLKLFVKTFWQNVMVVTFLVNVSCLKNKKLVKNV